MVTVPDQNIPGPQRPSSKVITVNLFPLLVFKHLNFQSSGPHKTKFEKPSKREIQKLKIKFKYTLTNGN